VGATNTTLILANAQFTNAGNYTVLVSNVVNSILSSNAVLTVNPLSCDPPPAGLVSWWGAEGNALDQVGGNNGTLMGSVSYGSGKVGQAFVFGADQAGVLLGNPTNLWLQNFTIETWIKRSSVTVSSLNYPDADLFASGQGGYGFGLNGDGSLFLTQIGVGNVTANAGVRDTNWHHVAVSKSGSTVVFYADGVAYPAPAYNPTFVFVNTGLGLGARGDNLWNSFYGAIDELSVYNRALSSSEIQGIYLAGSAGKCFTPVAPIITSQPTNQTVFVGQTASFSVLASGTPPLSYQWRFNTTNLVGATNATLLLPSAQFTNAGIYSVIVSNVINSILSSNAVLTVNPPLCDPSPTGLVSWWAAEGNALDQVGGNNGSLVGNTSYGTGEVGQGFVFTGNGSGVQVGGTTNLWLQNLTIETWIKRASTSVVSGSGGNATIFGYGTGAYLFGINSAGNLFFSQQGNFAYVSGPAITDTNFHHVAVSMVGSTVVFYLDRVAYATPAYPVTFTFTGGPPGIGFWAERGDTGFLGTIDELSVYNRALSPSEIQGIYNASSAGKCFTPVAPSITSQPTNQTVFAGQTASFSVSASGTPPLSYQWRFNTTNLVGANQHDADPGQCAVDQCRQLHRAREQCGQFHLEFQRRPDGQYTIV